MARTPGFGFPSALWGLLVMFNSQEDGFPVRHFRRFRVACVSPELGSGAGRDFDLRLLQVWTVGLENWLLRPVLQLLCSSTSGKPFPP